jgi:hypothetical protein
MTALQVPESRNDATGKPIPLAAGCLGTGCLHVVVSLVVMGVGSALLGREGPLIVLPFWLFLGVAQWIYLAPAALALNRLGHAATARGVWLGAWLVVVLNVVYWAGLGVRTLFYQREVEAVKRFEQEHPITHRDVAGTIVVATASRIDVRTPEGILSVELRPTTHYIQTNGPFGNTKATPDIVKVGAAVVVDAVSFDGGPLYADYVSMEVPEPEQPNAGR